jgi:hypothetical protein
MPLEDLLLAVRTRPFIPFRILLTNGESLESDCAGLDYSFHEEPALGHGRGGFRAC